MVQVSNANIPVESGNFDIFGALFDLFGIVISFLLNNLGITLAVFFGIIALVLVFWIWKGISIKQMTIDEIRYNRRIKALKSMKQKTGIFGKLPFKMIDSRGNIRLISKNVIGEGYLGENTYAVMFKNLFFPLDIIEKEKIVLIPSDKLRTTDKEIIVDSDGLTEIDEFYYTIIDNKNPKRSLSNKFELQKMESLESERQKAFELMKEGVEAGFKANPLDKVDPYKYKEIIDEYRGIKSERREEEEKRI